jgi:MFS family permease
LPGGGGAVPAMRTPKNESKASPGRKQPSADAGSGLGIRGFPRQVYFMVLVNFVMGFGRNIAFPYLYMYLGGKIEDGGLQYADYLLGFMIMIGVLSYLVMLPVAGSLCDRLGRRKMMGTALISFAVLAIGYAYAKTYTDFLLLHVAFNGLGAFYDPAFGAMVADLVEPARREEAFGLSYMIGNVAGAFAGFLGGVIAYMSGYPILFVYASLIVVIAVVIFLFSIRESRPKVIEKVRQPKFTSAFRDRLFILFCITIAFTLLLYSQFGYLLGVYTQDAGFDSMLLGILIALNCAMVVALQIPIRKGALKLGPTKAFILAQLLFAIGFTYFMFAEDLYQFLLADVVLTLGEITYFPTSSAFVANLAPKEMRGRYMSLTGVFSSIGMAVGSQVVYIVYGLLSAVDKHLIWGFLGLIGFATLFGYIALSKQAAKRKKSMTIEKQRQSDSSANNRKM